MAEVNHHLLWAIAGTLAFWVLLFWAFDGFTALHHLIMWLRVS